MKTTIKHICGHYEVHNIKDENKEDLVYISESAKNCKFCLGYIKLTKITGVSAKQIKFGEYCRKQIINHCMIDEQDIYKLDILLRRGNAVLWINEARLLGLIK